MKFGSEKGKRKKVSNIHCTSFKVYGVINTESYRAKLREVETIVSTDLLELLVLLCSIIMQQYYTLQCTIRRVSSATLPQPYRTSHLRLGIASTMKFSEGKGIGCAGFQLHPCVRNKL